MLSAFREERESIKSQRYFFPVCPLKTKIKVICDHSSSSFSPDMLQILSLCIWLRKNDIACFEVFDYSFSVLVGLADSKTSIVILNKLNKRRVKNQFSRLNKPSIVSNSHTTHRTSRFSYMYTPRYKILSKYEDRERLCVMIVKHCIWKSLLNYFSLQ